ncbi:MAG: hypothetical protein ABSF76_12075, partial [Opitutaceae bacterium]
LLGLLLGFPTADKPDGVNLYRPLGGWGVSFAVLGFRGMGKERQGQLPISGSQATAKLLVTSFDETVIPATRPHTAR